MTESRHGPYASDVSEEEWRSGKRRDGTPITQSGTIPAGFTNHREGFQVPESERVKSRPWTPPAITSEPAPAHGLKATGAFIEGTHVDANKTDGDVHSIATRVLTIQAQVADLGAEAKRIADAAVRQLDDLKKLAKYDNKEATLRAHAAAYDDLQHLIDNELVGKRGWVITSARDAVLRLFNDNHRLTARVTELETKLARYENLSPPNKEGVDHPLALKSK